MPPSALSPLPPLLRAALLPSRPSRGRAPRPDVSVRAEPASLAGPGIGARQRRWLTATPPRGFLSEPRAGLAAPPPPPPRGSCRAEMERSLLFALLFPILQFPVLPYAFLAQFFTFFFRTVAQNYADEVFLSCIF